jgi:hypothetical protein
MSPEDVLANLQGLSHILNPPTPSGTQAFPPDSVRAMAAAEPLLLLQPPGVTAAALQQLQGVVQDTLLWQQLVFTVPQVGGRFLYGGVSVFVVLLCVALCVARWQQLQLPGVTAVALQQLQGVVQDTLLWQQLVFAVPQVRRRFLLGGWKGRKMEGRARGGGRGGASDCFLVLCLCFCVARWQ